MSERASDPLSGMNVIALQPILRSFIDTTANNRIASTIFDELFWKLIQAAEGNQGAVSAVLCVTTYAVSKRLRGSVLKTERWEKYCRERRPLELKAAKLRWWWRRRLNEAGVNAATISEDDPVWHACHRRPRGWFVLRALDDIQKTGARTNTLEGMQAILDRVDVIASEYRDAIAARLPPGALDLVAPAKKKPKTRKPRAAKHKTG